jgi:hypothetical protein
MISMYGLYLLGMYLILCPEYYTKWILELEDLLSITYKFKLLGVGILHFIASMFFEIIVIKYLMHKVSKYWKRLWKKQTIYDQIKKGFKFYE